MGAIIKVRDEFFGTKSSEDPATFDLELISAGTTPAEIIRQRVEDEVDAVNAERLARHRQENRFIRRSDRTRSFLIDIEPGSVEEKLNRPRGLRGLTAKLKKPPKLLDAEPEVKRALEAFGQNRIVMLFNDTQVDDLELPLTVTPNTEVTFIHLSPLRGG